MEEFFIDDFFLKKEFMVIWEWVRVMVEEIGLLGFIVYLVRCSSWF